MDLEVLKRCIARRDIARLGGEGILQPEDLLGLGKQTQLVLGLMRDGQWKSRTEIEAVSGGLEGMRRMRELRRWYTIERRQRDGRLWEYRIVGEKRWVPAF